LNLSKTFPDGTRALRDVSLVLKRGEFNVILGPSGSGKTTLLRTINHLVEPSSGNVVIDGTAINQVNKDEVRAKISMVFQNFNLIGNLSAQNNVLTGLLSKKSPISNLFYLFNRQQKLLALEALDQVGLLSKAFARADQLSGGQQQRVGIARAIVKKPLLMLADEPVASLDPMISFQVLSLLKKISLSQGITILCNLHQVDLALRFADRIIGLAEGRIVMDKSVEDVDGEYIQNIYKGHNQGLFFGPNANQSGIDDIVSYKP
jgi:phosphonate transport system ATP-binding protein